MLGVTAFGLLFTPTFYGVCPALFQQFGKHTAPMSGSARSLPSRGTMRQQLYSGAQPVGRRRAVGEH
jgi:hypothetical protein